MKTRCVPIEDLPSVDRLAPTDPRRIHIDQCPRCRARWLSYRDFQDPDALPPEAMEQDASAALATLLEQRILGTAGRDAGSPAGPPKPSQSPLRRAVALLLRPALRPAWAVLAVAVLVVAIQQALEAIPGGEDRAVLRGDERSTGAVLDATLGALGSEGWLISWQPVADADRYEVVFFGANLAETWRGSADQETSLLLSTSADVAVPDGDPSRYWRVFAFRGEHELARSPLTALPRPE